MSIRVARKLAAESDRARALLVLIEAALTLQAGTAEVIRLCLDHERSAGVDLARQVGRLTSSYAYLISQVDELPSSSAVDEAASTPVSRAIRQRYDGRERTDRWPETSRASRSLSTQLGAVRSTAWRKASAKAFSLWAAGESR